MIHSERTAVFPGSFDPYTLGHHEIVESALQLFDRVILLVGINAAKRSFLTSAQRVQLIHEATAQWPQVEVVEWSHLVADFLRERNLRFIVRGLRNTTELEWERSMAWTNTQLLPGCQTVFLPSSPGYLGISSTLVRDLLTHGGSVAGLVPAHTLSRLQSFVGNA